MNCPLCNAALQPEAINIQKDIAKCNTCGHVFAISSVFRHVSKFDVNLPPKGAWYTSDFVTTTVGATTRSPLAFFLAPFMVVWSGGSLGGIYGMQFVSGKFNLILSLFGIPFLIGSIVFWGVAMMAIFGKIEVTFDQESGKIFTGIGKLGYTKRFLWKDVEAVEESMSNVRTQGSQQYQINLVGQTRVSFGTGLSNERRYYIMNVLRAYLSRVKR